MNLAFVLQHITVESRFPPPPMLFPHIVLEGRSAPTDQLFLCVRSAAVPSLSLIEKMCGIRQPAEVCSCCLRLLKDLDLACRAITVGEQNKEFSLGIQGRDSPRPQVPPPLPGNRRLHSRSTNMHARVDGLSGPSMLSQCF